MPGQTTERAFDTWRQAVRQYQEDRDPRAPLFDFKRRTQVHFAADPDEVHMIMFLERQEEKVAMGAAGIAW